MAKSKKDAENEKKIDFKTFYQKNQIQKEQYKDGHLILVSPIPVSVNHYMCPRGFVVYKNGKPTVQISMYTTSLAQYYKTNFAKYVKSEVAKQNWDIKPTETRHHFMDCTFYFPRIDMDEQNYYKIMCDSMNKICYDDDHFILTSAKRIYYDNKNPRVEIDIYKTDYIGIFDNEEKLNEFIGNCEHCNRYKNNCSILNKAIRGNIQEEIINGSCTVFKEIKVKEIKIKKKKDTIEVPK